MSRTWKIILIAVGVVLVFLIVAKTAGWIGKSNNEFTVETEEVKARTIVETVTASGKIQPETEVKITSEVSGEIIQLPVVEGQQVKEGDLLVRINPDIYESAVTRSRAAVNSAKAGRAQARAQLIESENIYNRNKKLYDDQVISDVDYEAAQRAYSVAQASYDAAEYQLKSAEANLDEAQNNLKRTIIKAPASGTISSLDVELGERVVGTAQMAGTEMLRVANLESMEVLVEVNENDIVRVHLNDTAIIEVDAYLDEEFKGVVTEIANSANTVGASADQVTNFDVKIRILKTSYAHLMDGESQNPFRPGMTATVDIRTKTALDVPSVPIQAVTTRTDTSTKALTYKMRKKNGNETDEDDDEEFEVVFLASGGKAGLRVVKTGVQDDKHIEILEGLEVGDEVITGPYNIISKRLKNGSTYEVKGGSSGKKAEDEDEEEESES
jgi:HlyD family secretion protein